MKYTWKVDSPPTGRYRSFDRRGWPSAHYENDSPAAWIHCEDEYIPSRVKTGEHKPLTVYVADYSTPDGNCPWKRRKMANTFATLAEAKLAFYRLLETHPELMPKS